MGKNVHRVRTYVKLLFQLENYLPNRIANTRKFHENSKVHELRGKMIESESEREKEKRIFILQYVYFKNTLCLILHVFHLLYHHNYYDTPTDSFVHIFAPTSMLLLNQ